MSEPKSILAIVPARGGSKGIPRKNLALVGGIPLLGRTLEHARRAALVDHTVVSTDDDEIAALARAYGAEVVRRPAALAGDEASSEAALLHVLGEFRREEGYEPELVVFLQATSPLRREGDIDRAVETLRRQGADSLFSACPVHGFVWRRGDRLEALTYDPAKRPRRQDLGEDLLENGSIYVMKPWVLTTFGNRLGGEVAVYPMDPLDSFQIDKPADLELFERLLRLPSAGAARGPDLSAIRLLVLDFDGVLTDDRVVVHQDGSEAVVCHRGDGFGLERLRRRGAVEAVVLSKEENPVVAARCRKLGLACFQGYDDKLPKLIALAEERGLDASEVAYVGNDLNDLEAMAWCGVAIAVADARPEVLAAADHVTRRPGGRGAVREVCDLLSIREPE